MSTKTPTCDSSVARMPPPLRIWRYHLHSGNLFVEGTSTLGDKPPRGTAAEDTIFLLLYVFFLCHFQSLHFFPMAMFHNSFFRPYGSLLSTVQKLGLPLRSAHILFCFFKNMRQGPCRRICWKKNRVGAPKKTDSGIQNKLREKLSDTK